MSLLLVAACSGDGKTGLAPGAIDEQLTYDPGTFGYVDPHAPDFHPLGVESFRATEREELVLFLADAPRKPALDALYRDDVVVGSGDFCDCGDNWTGSGFSPMDRAVGDIDGDGRPEPIFIGVEEDTWRRRPALRIGQPDVHGGPIGIDHVERIRLEGDPWPGDLTHMQVELADLDGDGGLELVTAQSWERWTSSRLSVYDVETTPDGLALRLLGRTAFNACSTWMSRGQFDFDRAEELVVTLCDVRRDAYAYTAVFDDLQHGLHQIGMVWSGPPERHRPAPLVGDFDGDGKDELVLETDSWNEGLLRKRRLVHYDWVDKVAVPMAELVTTDRLAWNDRLGPGLAAADRDKDGLDEVLWVGNRPHTADVHGLEQPYGLALDGGCFAAPCQVMVELRSWQPVTGFVERHDLGVEGAHPTDPRTSDLVVLDQDATGNTIAIAAWKVGLTDQLRTAAVGPAGMVVGLGTQLTSSGARPLMAAGDFDDDGLRLRYVGKKLELPTPVPIALLAAPPTKDGILQNQTNSKARQYPDPSGASVFELRPAMTVSLGLGRDVEDLFGVIDVDECDRLKDVCVDSLGEDCPVVATADFTTGFDKNAVLFAGILHQVYEYEVLSAPNAHAVGELLSVNVPVDVRFYRWSLGHYEDVIPPEQGLPAGILPHGIGDPASYPTETELTGLLKSVGGDFEGWATPGVLVKKGSGLRELELCMEDELGYQPYHSIPIGLCEHIKAGGATCGLTAGLMDPLVYELRLLDSAMFDAQVGDVPHDEWAAWRYRFGMVVYQRELPDALPFFVQTFWTDPEGYGYP